MPIPRTLTIDWLPRYRWVVWWLMLLAWGITASGAEEGGFRVRNAETTLVDGVYQLRAHLDLQLSDDVLQALESGFPITLVIDINVGRKRPYFLWNDTIATLEQRYRLEYHSLTEQYQVTNLNTSAQETYPDLNLALRSIGEIANFPMIDRRLLHGRAHYDAGLRVRLDIESLPTPLRLVAYLSHGWHLGSAWFVWPLLIGAPQ